MLDPDGLFDTVVLRCPECEHDYSPAEMADLEDDEGWDGCPGCAREVIPEPLEVNLLREFVEKRTELGEVAEMISTRHPALRERVEAQVAEADNVVRDMLAVA